MEGQYLRIKQLEIDLIYLQDKKMAKVDGIKYHRTVIINLWKDNSEVFDSDFQSYILQQFQVSNIFEIKVLFKLNLILSICKYILMTKKNNNSEGLFP